METVNVLGFQEHGKKVLDSLYGELIRPGDNFGQVSRVEAEFLMHRIWQKNPQVVLEIGVASGASSAAILGALLMTNSRAKLIALDCLDTCYFDERLDVGFMVPKVFGEAPSAYELHAGVPSLDLETILDGRTVDFLFIDGNHSHPWACIDTILALPFLSPGAIVVYHDINLHLFGGASKALSKGPHQLFYSVDAIDKVVVGVTPFPNIGALVFPESAEKTLLRVFSVMFGFPWETDAWPTLDKKTVLHLAKFIGKHFGNRAKIFFLEASEIASS